MFGSGSSMVFSLSKEKELVKLQERKTKARGRGRVKPSKPHPVGGRGGPGAGGTQQIRYPAPKSGSGGITVIEPLDGNETDPSGQFEDVPEEDAVLVEEEEEEVVVNDDQPGLPLRGSGGGDVGVAAEFSSAVTDDSNDSKVLTEEVEGQRGGEAPSSEGGVGGVQQQEGMAQSTMATKPKRYSSQRQKGAGEKLQ